MVVLWLMVSATVFAAEQSPETRPIVVTSIRPLALLAADLAGDKVDVHELLAPGQEPHHVALAFSQRRLLRDASLVLWVGPSLEPYLVKALAARDGDSIAMDAGMDNLTDPHIWLNPDTVMHYAAQITAALKQHFPSNNQIFDERYRAFSDQFAMAVEAVSQQLASLKKRPVIVEHNAYSHFAAYFNVGIAGSLTDTHDTAAGARTLTQLYAIDNVTCLVVEQMPGSARAQQLAKRLAINTVEIDPLATHVPIAQGMAGLYRSIGDGFEECLAGKLH
jgi:zinc transport system substrate-binding protein